MNAKQMILVPIISIVSFVYVTDTCLAKNVPVGSVVNLFAIDVAFFHSQVKT